MSKDLTELSDEELLLEGRKIKSSNIMDAMIIGVLIGISIYSAFRNGVGLLSFLPFVYLPIAAKNRIRNKQVEDLLKEKNLK
jgi:hypothetical protein